ncbi:hypothetical protein PTKIN_Ptkin11bG0203200 [Pterospermum kingtungense]
MKAAIEMLESSNTSKKNKVKAAAESGQLEMDTFLPNMVYTLTNAKEAAKRDHLPPSAVHEMQLTFLFTTKKRSPSFTSNIGHLHASKSLIFTP